MSYQNEADYVTAVETAGGIAFNSAGEQIAPTGLDGSADRVAQPDLIVPNPASVTTITAPVLSGVRYYFLVVKYGGSASFFRYGTTSFYYGDCITLNAGFIGMQSAGASATLATTSSTLRLSSDNAGQWIVIGARVNADSSVDFYHTGAPDVVNGVPNNGGMLTPQQQTRKLGINYAADANNPHRASKYVCYSGTISDQDFKDICNRVTYFPLQNLNFYLINDGSADRDIGPNFYGSVVSEGLQIFGDVDLITDANGYGHELINGVVYAKRPDGKLLNGATDSGAGFSGVIKSKLTVVGGNVKLPDNRKLLTGLDVSGAWQEVSEFDPTTFTALMSPTEINPNLPELKAGYFGSGGGYVTVLPTPLTVGMKGFHGIGLAPLSLPQVLEGASIAVINKATGVTLDKRVLTEVGYSYSYEHTGTDIDFEVRIAKEGFKPQKLLITAGEGGVINNVELEPFPLWQTLAAGEGLTTGADVTELTPLPDRVQMTVALLKAQRVFIFAEWLNTLMDWIDTPYFMALESRGNSKVYFIAIQTILVDVLAGTHGTLIGGLIKNASGIALTHPDSAHYLQIDPEEVYEYIPAVGAEGFTADDRTQLNKGLTADEFAAAV